jgi:cytosine/adenosine deaminase-related metal-dependent hydrolase
VRIALGSDAVGSSAELNPYLNIMLASLHPTVPAEAISREMAVEAYTRNAAYAEFKEQEKGTLERGKLADIAVLSQDIFTVPPTALPATESILTMIGGRVVYDAGIDGEILAGTLSSRTARRLIKEWAAAHRPELQANWNRLEQGEALERIAPLE